MTLSQIPRGKYYASILCEYESQVQTTELKDFLGLDFSMKELYKNSNKNEPCYPRYYRQVEKRLKREQRKLSLMKKGSSSRDKQRKDFLHTQSRQITNAYDCVCIESLDMRAMSQALHFGKSVSDNCWEMFATFLQYKYEIQNGNCTKV